MENPNPDIRLRYHEYPKVLSNTKKAKKQKELELKRDLSTTIERLIFEPSLTEMKKIVKCLQMILTSKFDYYFAPYLTADMLLTWNIIFQYLIWENIFANFKIYHIFFTLPVFILKMMIFKIPLKMIKFQYEIYFFILNSAYKRIFNLGKKESNLNHQPFSL